MKYVFVPSSGRSGTSLTVRLLAKAAYFMGNDLIPAREANPKGFFEDRVVNRINQQILAPVAPTPSPFIERFLAGRRFFEHRLKAPRRWLARLPLGVEPVAEVAKVQAMCWLVGRSPYQFNDLRFCYTLPTWRRHLQDTVLLRVFRHLLLTAHRVVKEVRRMPGLRYLYFGWAEAMGAGDGCMSALRRYREERDWLCLHFNKKI